MAKVLVIESGGFETNAALQELLVGECAGIDYPLVEARARCFGGSSALWAGYCATFDPLDFVRRDWVPESGWPFEIDALTSYYSKTARLLNLGDSNFDARDIARRAGVELPFDNEILVPSAWRFGSPTVRFGEQFRKTFEASIDLTTLTYANAVDLKLDAEHSKARELVIRTLDGREGRVAADIFILACGGIETPRILLNANTQIHHGLGNSSDMVGRFFMEHPHLSVGTLHLQDPSPFSSWLKRGTYDGGQEFLLSVGLADNVQAEARILNARAHVYRTPSMDPNEMPKVGIFMEQAPNPDSRITLSNRTDLLGMRRARLDWRLTKLDWNTYEKTASILCNEFVLENVGSTRAEIQPASRNSNFVLHSNHQLGTTRMSKDRSDGVVDPNCRVHDLSNLYIAGGGIFPTVSWANPTFTLIALVFRLADHLRGEIDPNYSRT